jgi:hypothetical protein
LGGGSDEEDKIDIVCRYTFVRSEELLISFNKCIVRATEVASSKNILMYLALQLLMLLSLISAMEVFRDRE